MSKTPTSNSRFGHHPDPAIDFCIEVEELQAMEFNRSVKFDSHTDFENRLFKALQFNVGGDSGCIKAKEILRKM